MLAAWSDQLRRRLTYSCRVSPVVLPCCSPLDFAITLTGVTRFGEHPSLSRYLPIWRRLRGVPRLAADCCQRNPDSGQSMDKLRSLRRVLACSSCAGPALSAHQSLDFDTAKAVHQIAGAKVPIQARLAPGPAMTMGDARCEAFLNMHATRTNHPWQRTHFALVSSAPAPIRG